MIELASDSVEAVSSFPEAIALSFPEMLTHRQTDQFVPSVSKPALGPIVAITKFGVSFAELRLVLLGVCLAVVEVIFSLLAAVTLSGSRLF